MRSLLFLSCSSVLVGLAACTRADDDLSTIVGRYRAQLGTAPSWAVGRIEQLKPDGSFADVDYASQDRSNWTTTRHLSYLRGIAAISPATPAATQALNRGLDYWRQHDFQCPNWWYNVIGVPMTMGEIGILASDRLSPENLGYLVDTVLPRSKISMTGQNRAWVAGNTFVRALLKHDEALARQAMAVIIEELRVTDQEGLQPDWSFHQHGPQQQFGNYGLAFAGEMSQWADLLRGTSLAFGEDKLALLRNYVLEGENWVCWRGYMDLSSCDRQITPGAMRGKARSVANINTRMASVDPAQTAAYQAAARRNQPGAANDLVGSRYFWRSDYVIHRRPEFMATLKMSSKRVIGAELVNNENLSGYYLADGALFWYRAGDELEDVAPVWDWRKVPGVTCPQGNHSLRPDPGKRLPSDYVGAACDGQSSAVMLGLTRDGLSVRRMYCFAGDLVVCLGSGLSYTGAEPVTTSLLQQRLKGAVRLSTGGAARDLAEGQQTFDDAQWLEHDGLRISLLEKARLVVKSGPQTGNWRQVFGTSGTPKADVTLPICSAWLDHGAKPSGTFVYALSPAGAAATPTVVANTEAAQVVRLANGLVAAALWEPTTVDLGNGHKLGASLACTVLYDAATGALTVAEPTQKFKALTLTLDGRDYKVDLPTGGRAGSSVVLTAK